VRRHKGLGAPTAEELLCLAPPALDLIMSNLDELLAPVRAECKQCEKAAADDALPSTRETEAVQVSGFRPRVATCDTCPHSSLHPSRTLVASVVESLMEGQIIRPLDAEELAFICGWMFYRFHNRGSWLIETGADVLQILDQLYFYWPDNIEDIWVDRAKFSTQQQMDIFVYTKDPYPPRPRRCRCADPIAAPKPHPQILLCTAGGYPERPAPYWGWIAAADVAGSMHATGTHLREHLIYSINKPLLVCMEGQTDTSSTFVGTQRCSKCFCHLHTECCFLENPGKRNQRSHEVCEYCRTVFFDCKECTSEYSQQGFSNSMWLHRNERGAVCLECEATAKCDMCGLATAKCDMCEELFLESGFTASMWHNKSDKTRPTLCRDCQKEPTHKCDLCGELKPRSEYPPSMWNHKSHMSQRTLCNDCCRPRCTAPNCKTCKVCRQPHRSCKKCEDPIVALEKSSLPTDVEQLNTWLCSVCKPKMCAHWPHCRKERRSKKSNSEAQYTCGECQTLEFNEEEHRKHFASRTTENK